MVPMPPPFMSDDSDSNDNENESGEKDRVLNYSLVNHVRLNVWPMVFSQEMARSCHCFLITLGNMLSSILKSQ